MQINGRGKKIPTLSNSTLSCSPDQATNSETTGFFLPNGTSFTSLGCLFVKIQYSYLVLELVVSSCENKYSWCIKYIEISIVLNYYFFKWVLKLLKYELMLKDDKKGESFYFWQ